MIKLNESQILILSITTLLLFNLYATFTSTFYFNTVSYFVKQSVFLLTGMAMGIFLYLKITSKSKTVRSLRKFFIVNVFFIVLTVFLSLLLFILPESFLPTINGAKRWIKFMGITIAPIEVTKLSYIFIFTHIFSSSKFENNKDTRGLFVFIPVYILFTIYLIVITYKQKDLGNFFLFSTIFITMIILYFNKLRVVFKMIGIGILGLAAMIVLSPHRRDRIMQWFESTSEVGSASANYQVEQGFFAINEGGYFGVGPGEGVMKLGYIPEPHTDMIISVIINEIGVFGISLYVIALFSLIYVFIKKAVRLNNLYLLNYTILTSLMLTYQLIVNMFGVLGIIPLKGINVPFLSYGGSSAVSIIVLVFLNLALIKIIEKKPRRKISS